MSLISRSIGRSPQIRLDDPRIVLDLGGQTLRDLLAEVEHGDPVADAHDQAHVVLDQQDGTARVADLLAALLESLLLGGVHPRRGLVEQQQLRIRGQRAGDLQPPLVTVRQVLRRLVDPSADADELHQLLGLGPALALLFVVPGKPQRRAGQPGAVVRVRADEDVLQRRHVVELPDVLERPCDTELGHLEALVAVDTGTVEDHLALGRPVHPGDDIEDGRLPRAVRTDQSEDLALVDPQLETVDRDDAAEAHRQAAQFEHGLPVDCRRGGLRGTHSLTSPATTVAGPPTSAPIVPIPPVPSASSAFRRRDGSRPSGRKTIRSTRTPPKTRIRYSCRPRIRSGIHATRKAPRTTPGRFPEPPRTTAARIVADRMNGKFVGMIDTACEAYTTPVAPPIAAPIANAASLNLNVGTPISSAASSSSRMDAQARPTLLFSSRFTKMIARTMTISIR